MNGFIAFMLIRCTQKTGTPTALPHIVSAPESALGSHPCVALSSAQVNSILHQVETLPKGRFLLEATGIFIDFWPWSHIQRLFLNNFR